MPPCLESTSPATKRPNAPACSSVATYDITLDLTTVRDDLRARRRSIRSPAREPGASTFADLVGATVHEITLNGRALDPSAYDDSRIALDRPRRPTTSCASSPTAPTATRGEGLHRFVDPVDKLVYLYTQFEVPDARRVFATFEQPDLKAAFTFHVTAPAHWQVVSNSPTPEPVDLGLGRSRLALRADASGMSTYITALVAGDYAVVRDTYHGKRGEIPLGIFCRQSLREHLDADDIFDRHQAGLRVLRGRLRHGVPVRQVRPAVRARVQHGRDGERRRA